MLRRGRSDAAGAYPGQQGVRARLPGLHNSPANHTPSLAGTNRQEVKACGWLRRPRLTTDGGGEADPRGWLHGWCAWRQAAQEAVAVTEFRSRRAASPTRNFVQRKRRRTPAQQLARRRCALRCQAAQQQRRRRRARRWTCSSRPARRRLNGGAEARQDSVAGSMRGVLGGGGLGSGGGGGERATAALGSGLVPERVHAQPR